MSKDSNSHVGDQDLSDLESASIAALDVAVSAIGGSARKGQIEMAQAVSRAISRQEHLLVQAGTGTGKSLAYLIPAIVSGKRTLVATATLALQRQLVERDLPKIQGALQAHLEREITFATYKGVGNYICKAKLYGSGDIDNELIADISSLERDAKRLRDWGKIAGISGDKDDAPLVDRRVWAASSVSGRECVGADDCRYGSSCFAVLAKSKAARADVVVTNHTLLAIEVVDSHPILPEREIVILDEAHEFSDRTTQANTEELSSARILRAANMYKKYERDKAGKLVNQFLKAAQDFEDAISEYRDALLTNSEGQRSLEEIPAALESPLRRVKEAVEAIAQRISADSEISDSDDLTERARVKGAINEIKTVATKMLRKSGAGILWFEPTFSTFYLAPLTVSEVLAENLFSHPPVIATSATLTVGKSRRSESEERDRSFNSIEASLGIAEMEGVARLDVGSPFDFERQGMLYLASHLAEPTRDGTSVDALDELAELIEAAGGRTLALFSSWRAVEAADLHLRKVLADLEINIITARRGDGVGQLVERFIEDESSILIGTIALWQGVDVPGRACTLVAIDRIPFPRPDDPVTATRARLADEAGGSGFMEVSLPRAALLLAQGTGRLIRSLDDRGVVAILDSRITRKRYGSILLDSMPPLWRTEDGALVKESLRRLNQSFLEQSSTK
jgi:ATP-dependent DNA helicase DinG